MGVGTGQIYTCPGEQELECYVRLAEVRVGAHKPPVPELSYDMIWRYVDIGESRGDWICERVMGGVIGL